MADKNIHLWFISDGKPGHINQSLGLLEALQRRIPNITWREIPVMSACQAIRFARQHHTQCPNLVLSTGHRTHLTLLILCKIMRVPSIVLMKPSLPFSWFDLCIIPEHDLPPARSNIITSMGPLNKIQPVAKEAGIGVILVGGPSKHFDWQPEQFHAQLKALIQQDPRNWTIATSRRTPDATISLLRTLALANVTLVLAAETDTNWLPRLLAKTELCWVTQDSMSMIYEALTAGCNVKLLDVPSRSENRLTHGIQKLQLSGYLSSDTKPPLKLAESDRCAEIIQQRFLS
ncbi:MAG: mitochondrial fission ELM1 family protein [Gammaproteobacteria bacterium]|nr:mitochondrial fission ELM1 family protein [Gammaproteobacteria bacterium]